MSTRAKSETTSMTPLIIHEFMEELTGVAKITLNRPHVHNALDEKTIEELTKAFLKLSQDPSVRAIVLAANGTVFCAGADLNWMKRVSALSQDKSIEDAMKLSQLLDVIDTCPKPTIACIQGAAFGGGVGLIAACDIAVCAKEAVFCLSEVKWGLIPATISPYIINAIGQRQARRYVLTADRMSSGDALHFGLVHQVVMQGELEAAIETLAVSILKGSPAAIKASKELIRFVESRPIDSSTHKETARRLASARLSAEGKEGIEAFLAKRTPSWAL
ncbi:MAG: enoyl-CoA hydratase/isomerase family protein [Alphaproteobacteria bacterium]|nr:enoyl-CoA hydratase/isomerase family protein [Alphaproteobacteria bacterium]